MRAWADAGGAHGLPGKARLTHDPPSRALCPSLSQVIAGMDHHAYQSISTLMVNEGSSKIGVHHDPPAPLPALIAGPGTHQLINGEWKPMGGGGRLFTASSTSRTARVRIVLIDANLPHGITRLSAPKGLTGSRAELERFSLIVFSTFKRADRTCSSTGTTLPCGRTWRDAVL